MRVKTQELSVFTEDLNAFHVSSTDTGSPFANLAIDGADGAVKTDVNGVKSIDLDSKTLFIPLISFETGATGSTAVVTITGEGFDGSAMTEDVTMPGASGDVQATKLFRKITKFEIDGAYTNLEVGVKAEIDQFSKFVVFDTYANPFAVFLDLFEVTNGSTLTIELSNDQVGLFTSPVDPNAVNVFDAVAPFAAGITATQSSGVLSADADVPNLPFIAARLRHTAGTAGKWRARFQQSGGGFGR